MRSQASAQRADAIYARVIQNADYKKIAAEAAIACAAAAEADAYKKDAIHEKANAEWVYGLELEDPETGEAGEERIGYFNECPDWAYDSAERAARAAERAARAAARAAETAEVAAARAAETAERAKVAERARRAVERARRAAERAARAAERAEVAAEKTEIVAEKACSVIRRAAQKAAV